MILIAQVLQWVPDSSKFVGAGNSIIGAARVCS